MEPDSCHSVQSFDNQTFYINQQKIDWLCSHILHNLGLGSFELAVSFVSPSQIQDLNQQYRHRNQTTDVLSFPQQQWPKPISLTAPYTKPSAAVPQVLGDIAISLVDAQRNAKSIGQGLDRELCFLIIHGILHLCGHDHSHSEEEKIMIEQQRTILKLIESHSPPPWQNCVRIGV